MKVIRRNWTALVATTQINMRLRRHMTPEILLAVLRGEIRAQIWSTHLEVLCALPPDELQRLAAEVGTDRDIKALTAELLAEPPTLDDLQADMDRLEGDIEPLAPKMGKWWLPRKERR